MINLFRKHSEKVKETDLIYSEKSDVDLRLNNVLSKVELLAKRGDRTRLTIE